MKPGTGERMTFWIITALMAFGVTAMLALALLRARSIAGPAADYDLRVYRDQLKEVDRDLARGVIAQGDAERIRTEISRRILAADAQQGDAGSIVSQPGLPGYIMAAAVGIALIGGSFLLYSKLGAFERFGTPVYGDLSLKDRIAQAETARETRPDQAVAEASLPPAVPPGPFNPEHVALVEQLRETIKMRPDDLQGHVLLARNEATMGNFVAAYKAQERVINIKGGNARASDLMDYGEMLILAAGGYVSPEAENALAQALQLDHQNAPALYYYGLMFAQTGRPDQTFRIWERLLRDGPPDAPWIEPIRLQIMEMAQRAGVNYQLPEPRITPERGPDASDVQAAAEMSEEDRLAMIEGMVNGLSDRLASEGGPATDWARLISALGVLGQEERAIAIYSEALEIFAGDEAAITLIRNGARQALLIP
jgi:cytochrome c-type biogenesis protein CcmH